MLNKYKAISWICTNVVKHASTTAEMYEGPHYRLSSSIISTHLWLYSWTCTGGSSPPVALRRDLPPWVFEFHVNLVCNDTLSSAQMLLWYPYQAEVIFCHPTQRRDRCANMVKGPAFTQTKMTYDFIYILARVCGAECWESYLKLYKPNRYLSEVFFTGFYMC